MKIKKIFEAIWNYLKDWKNLLPHAIVGILLLVVALNILRMRLSEKKEQELEA
jgi:hypothetical protein